MDFYDNIKYAIKLLFSKEKELYSFYHNLLGFCPDNIAVYNQALQHRSEVSRINNERLEYLGDAIMTAIISDLLYTDYNKLREGELTKIRSKIVQRTSLNELADKIGITQNIRHFKKPSSHNCNVGGNAFEALIGAIYIDKGYSRCRKFLLKTIRDNFDLKAISQNLIDYKSKLLEWGQKHKKSVDFILVSTSCDKLKNPVFQTEVVIDKIPYGKGTGYSKKESQQAAAKETYTQLFAKKRSDKSRNATKTK